MQSRLLFLAGATDAPVRLQDQARTYLAWGSIVSGVESIRLNLDELQAKQAKDQRDEPEKTLRHAVRDTFRRLVSPAQEVR
jgi:hypothetical protein